MSLLRLQSTLRVCMGLVVAGGLACGDWSGPNDSRAILWEADNLGGTHTHPAVVDSVVVIGALHGLVRGLRRSDGETMWSRRLPAGIVGDKVVNADGIAVVPQWELWGIEPSNGQVVWRFAGPDSAAGGHTPTVSGDTVFAVSPFGWVSAVNAKDGSAYWSTDVAEAPFVPAVSRDLVIVGTRGFLGTNRDGGLGAGHIIALRRSDGSEAWRFPLPDSVGVNRGGAVSGGVVWNDLVIVAGAVGHAFGLRLSDGTAVWGVSSGVDPGTFGYFVAPKILGGTAVLARRNWGVEGRDPATGTLLWQNQLASQTSPEINEPYGYLVSGKITAINETGATRWSFGGLTFGGGGISFLRPTIADDGTIFATGYNPSRGSYVYAVKAPLR